ncbi:uncharacterized protein LOC108623558 [Ceratina calcarata]|uniref:Uncharacterized protein LOC108623558 n=1 Tax=Ceratina calcarata TaxID=156304 RepID=A0AAJ7IUV1_9HYME|nr:uncharacterized protein LOC108623558 [Ceratina calcarata]
MTNDKSKEDYAPTYDNDLKQKYFIAWSPIARNKQALKHRYVSCSRSVPNRSKRSVQYKMSRSLNLDPSNSVHNSSSDSSFEEDKHLSRSAKIMRALNFNSSPSYFVKTKIKKSLNFNLTPSPKRFKPVKRNIRKSLSMNFNSPLSVSNKLSFDDSSAGSANSSIVFSSPESMDENQNETPSQSAKKQEGLHFSTPNATFSRRANFTPMLRSRLKQTIDDIICVTATPNSHIKGRSKFLSNLNTSRNLYHEFHEKDDDRPSTPKNVIHIVPESMSAIKRSHKKERSRRGEGIEDYKEKLENLSNEHVDALQDVKTYIEQYSKHSEGDISETGSLFDYTERENDFNDATNIADDIINVNDLSEIREIGTEQKNVFEDSKDISDDIIHDLSEKQGHGIKTEDVLEDSKNICDSISHLKTLPEIQELDIKMEIQDKKELTEKNNYPNLSNEDLKCNTRSLTPEPKVVSGKPVTPKNRINILERVANDSIKKSHKKVKDDKRRLFTPKILQTKFETEERENRSFENTFPVSPKTERSATPENINSSRLLLSQYSSVKKSHRKDKHNKILSGFLKRQEYFNKDMDFAANCKYKPFDEDCKNSTDDSDLGINIEDPTTLVSPNKRKKVVDSSLDTSCEFELPESDLSKEEFQIFSPLKRKRAIVSAIPKEYSHPYDSPSQRNLNNFSRCLTPIVNIPDSVKTGNDVITMESEANNEEGRSTPRNMSTTELYVNLDSIKKSHKKNKRGNVSRKGFNVGDGTPLRNSESMLNLSCETMDKKINELNNESVDGKASTSFAPDNEESISNENASTTVTPPNCLKTKSYIKMIQETSIKRSHKKVRDTRKKELDDEISDDGSIFDDEKLPLED